MLEQYAQDIINDDSLTRTEKLKRLIKEIANDIDKNGSTENISELVQPFRNLDVIPNMHVGRGAEMDDTEKGKLLYLEWFAGSILGVVESNAWFAVNKWLCMADSIVEDK